ncbi:MAG: protein translocase subunit SecF [Acidobacteria bacterium]|nr:protein translocase subunit SecF [Acidobacteriota bacterium]
MRLIGETHFDFMRWRYLWFAISGAFILLSIVMLVTRGVPRGVEFTGGAEVILRFAQPPVLDEIRGKLDAAGFKGVAATTFGESGGREVAIRVALDENRDPNAQRDLTRRIVDALRPAQDAEKSGRGMLDLNVADEVTIRSALVERGGVPEAEAAATAAAISQHRRGTDLLGSMDQVRQLPGVGEAARNWLAANAFTGSFDLRGQEFIEASVSAEMRSKALWAMLGALIGMLVYLWFRFQFEWGLAAVVALFHDVIVTIGIFIIAGYEADLPVVAAFLTLVGYSVNDTIVIFDRVRENIRAKGEGVMSNTLNVAINQTLSRSIITNLTVFFTVACLYFFGGPVLRPFSFVLLVGAIVGTYSTIYIASPVLLVWRGLLGRFRDSRERAKKGRAATAKAARTAR